MVIGCQKEIISIPALVTCYAPISLQSIQVDNIERIEAHRRNAEEASAQEEEYSLEQVIRILNHFRR